MRVRALFTIGTAAAAVLALAPAARAADGPQLTSLRNGGRACAATPGPSVNWARLDALAADLALGSVDTITYTFRIWPSADPADVTELTARSQPERAGTVTFDGAADGTRYTWQAQAADANGTTPWSESCSFTYDTTAPAAPGITSNYPPGEWGPPGQLARFTFDGGGDADVLGFVYSWQSELGVASCAIRPQGAVCSNPLTWPDTVRAATGQRTATVALDPPEGLVDELTVAAFDRAGNLSAPVSYSIWVSPTYPSITPVGPRRCDGVTHLRLAPDPAVHDVVGYDYRIGFAGDVQHVAANAYGTARLTVTTGPDEIVGVRSVSADGFTSGWWDTTVFVQPGVYSTQYPAGTTAGGVHRTGTFYFSPPNFLTDFTAYRYRFPDRPARTIADDGSGAQVRWTPSAPGPVTLRVRGQLPDGTWSCAASYSFTVAG